MVNELTVPVTSMATASIGLPVGLLAMKQPLGPESGPTVDPVLAGRQELLEDRGPGSV